MATYKSTPIKKQPRVMREWSKYQHDIFDNIRNGNGNTQVDALAGTGKTSTIVEGFYHLPRNVSTLMCAFNSSIKKELDTRAPEGVEVRTVHSIGYQACRRAFPKLGAPDDKGEKLGGYIKAEVGNAAETNELRDNLYKIIPLCKGNLAHTHEEIDPLIDRHDIDTCTDNRKDFIGRVIRILNACKKDISKVDFDDMIWLPNVLGLRVQQFDRVFGDEVQDWNIAQINLALSSLRANGRILTVGDTNQAIYSWRGADCNAINNIVERMNSKRFPLSVTYRCARNIVNLAKTIVPEIEASPSAEEGFVNEMSIDKMETMVKPGDFILSRVNAPLIRWCLALLRARIPANIKGRDIGKSLFSLIKKSKAKDVTEFLSWLADYETMEVERLAKVNRDTSVVFDKTECLRVLCEGTNSLADVNENLNLLFKDVDDSSRVVLSSTHKAKGLEADRVFMLKDTYRPTKGQEEANLTYVAYTRAKRELYLVSGV